MRGFEKKGIPHCECDARPPRLCPAKADSNGLDHQHTPALWRGLGMKAGVPCAAKGRGGRSQALTQHLNPEEYKIRGWEGVSGQRCWALGGPRVSFRILQRRFIQILSTRGFVGRQPPRDSGKLPRGREASIRSPIGIAEQKNDLLNLPLHAS